MRWLFDIKHEEDKWIQIFMDKEGLLNANTCAGMYRHFTLHKQNYVLFFQLFTREPVMNHVELKEST